MKRILPHFAMLAALLVGLVLPGSWKEASANPAAQVEALLDEAYDDFDFLDIDEAFAKLATAIDIIDAQGLSGPVPAQVWILYGMLINAAFEEDSATVDAFVQALMLDPTAEIDPYYATPTLTQYMEAARSLVQAPSAPAPPPPAPTPPSTPPSSAAPPQIQHNAPPGVPFEEALPLEVRVPRAMNAAGAAIFFRTMGETNFRRIEMNQDPANPEIYRGQIPASASRSVQVEYYLQIADAQGVIQAQFAGPGRPHIVPVMGAPIEDRRVRDRDRQRSDDPGGLFLEPERPEGSIGFVGLGAGTGVGLATAAPQVYGDRVELDPGLGFSSVHFNLELGVSPGRGPFALVLNTRLQPVFQEEKTDLLALASLRARYHFNESDRFALYAEGGLGYGRIGHLISLEGEDGTVLDVTYEGPFQVGAGFGAVHRFGDTIGLQHNLFLSFLATDISVHVDYTLSLQVRF